MATPFVDNLTCAICFDHLEDPKQLLCGHTFCKKCLVKVYKRKLQETLTCPLCRHVTSVEAGDVSRLPTNITLKSLVGNLKTATQACPQKKEPPYAAPSKSPSQQIPDQDKTREGKSWSTDKCDKHPDDTLAYFCKTCQKWVCFICRMLGCEKDGHEIAEEAENTNETQYVHCRLISELSETCEILADSPKHNSTNTHIVDDEDEETCDQKLSPSDKPSCCSKTADRSICDEVDPEASSDQEPQAVSDDVGYDPGGAECKSSIW